MVSSLAGAIQNILQKSWANNQSSPRMAILLDTGPSVATASIDLGYPTIIVGKRFRLLYRTYRRIQKKTARPLIIEASFSALPIRENSLNAIVLSRNIFGETSPLKYLQEIRSYLKPDGLVIWPHLAPGKIRRIATLGTKPIARSDLTALAMEAGFAEIGQVVVSTRLVAWIVTTGINKKRR